MDLGALRRDYRRATLDEVTAAPDAVVQFSRWFAEAQAAGVTEPNAMTLATVDSVGRPSARIVLLKGFGDHGFVFYTDTRSRKGRELGGNPAVALVFWWHELERQVRITGRAVPHDGAAADAYFATRPRGSQLGAWVSEQSSLLASRDQLDASLHDAESRFGADAVPRPPHWGGFRVEPDTIEFWQGRPNRLHDRLEYTRTPELGWRLVRLSP